MVLVVGILVELIGNLMISMLRVGLSHFGHFFYRENQVEYFAFKENLEREIIFFFCIFV